MKEFCRDYIKPLEDYDLETKGNLLETAINYVLNGADIQKTAQAMLQHKKYYQVQAEEYKQHNRNERVRDKEL